MYLNEPKFNLILIYYQLLTPPQTICIFCTYTKSLAKILILYIKYIINPNKLGHTNANILRPWLAGT